MFYPFFDWTLIIIIPGIIFSIWAQSRINGAYAKYGKIASSGGLTGAEVSRRILERENLPEVGLEPAQGKLADHYDPRTQVLRLSHDVANSTSIAALGVAAHETGHALQHRDGYGPLALRSASVPVVNIGSNLSWPLVLIGLIVGWTPLIDIGIALFAFVVLFTLITLPVERNASARALAALSEGKYLTEPELEGAKKVLDAASLTYVAAALTAVLQLMRLLAISGRGRSRD